MSTFTIVGIIIGVIWLTWWKIYEIKHNKSSWKILLKEIHARRIQEVGDFELVIYQPESITIQQTRRTKHFFGINKAKIFKYEDVYVFLPWGEDLIKTYYKPFQIISNNDNSGLESISQDWSFSPRSIDKKWGDLTITFLASSFVNTEVRLTIKNWII